MIAMTKRKWMLLTAGIAIMLLLAGCGGNNGNTANNGGNGGNNAGNGDTVAAVDAEAVYKKNCVSCHGADLSGYKLSTVGSRLSSEEISTQIKNGGGGMPGYGSRLDATEITALTDWLSAMK